MPRRPPATLLVLLAAFAFLALNGSVLLPLWEVPDENEHLDVVQHWAREGTMPDLTRLPTLGMNEGIQPPLAYWVMALGYRGLGLTDTEFLARQRHDAVGPDRALFLHGPDEEFPFAGPTRALHWLRLVSVLWGLATVAGAWALARRLVPSRPAVALGAAALVASQPVFTLLCGGINNDPAAIALCTWSLVALADLATCDSPTSRRLLATGLLIGAAHLAKLSALFLLPLVPLALLLGLGVAVNFASCLKYYLDFNQPQGRYLFPSLAAGAALLALGWSWLPRALGTAGALALLAASFHAQYATVGPAFHPLNRGDDPCLIAWDPVALVPESQRARTIQLLTPQDGSRHDEPPELRWALDPGEGERFSVHLGAPGLALRWRTWEVEGRPLRDRFRIPRELWESLPPGVELVAQVLRLPTLSQALAAWPAGPPVATSPPLHLLRR